MTGQSWHEHSPNPFPHTNIDIYRKVTHSHTRSGRVYGGGTHKCAVLTEPPHVGVTASTTRASMVRAVDAPAISSLTRKSSTTVRTITATRHAQCRRTHSADAASTVNATVTSGSQPPGQTDAEHTPRLVTVIAANKTRTRHSLTAGKTVIHASGVGANALTSHTRDSRPQRAPHETRAGPEKTEKSTGM